MSNNADTVEIAVTNAAKETLLEANPNRRGWLIQNLSTDVLQLFFNGVLVSGVQFAENVLPGCYPGLVEGQLVAGGPVNVQVTEFL